MLIETNSSQLGDKALDATEALAKLDEGNRALAAKHKIPGQVELEDVARSDGPRLDWQELCRRLTLCNPKFLFKDGTPGNIAAYLPKTQAEMTLSGYDLTRPAWHNEHNYVTGFPKEGLPEYSHIITDDNGLPLREVRGYRSILMALVKSGSISYLSVVKHFGEAMGSRASRWNQQLHDQIANSR